LPTPPGRRGRPGRPPVHQPHPGRPRARVLSQHTGSGLPSSGTGAETRLTMLTAGSVDIQNTFGLCSNDLMSALHPSRARDVNAGSSGLSAASKNADRGIRIAEFPPVLRPLKTLVFALAIVVTLATAALAFVSFTRKVGTFRTAGFTADRSGDALVVRTVDPSGAAYASGLRPGDRIVLADGRTAGSLAWPEEDLARRPFPHRLVVLSGGGINAVAIGEGPARVDSKYLFLAFVGLLYLVIGLFTVVRERAPASRVFWAVCLASFAIYVITPAGPPDLVWRLSWVAEDFYRALLPALLLHLFLIFP